MAYPPPPGLKATHSTASPSAPQPHPSLPARPPPPAGPLPSFKPTFAATPSASAGAPGTRNYSNGDGNSQQSSGGHGSFTAFKPRSVGGAGGLGGISQNWPNYTPTVSADPAPPSAFSAPQTAGYHQPQYQQQPMQSYYQPAIQENYSQSTAPQIRNPFPLPGQDASAGFGRGRGLGKDRYSDGNFDPEMDAQIAQWQSAYMSKDEAAAVGRAGRDAGASGTNANYTPLGQRANTATPLSHVEANVNVKPEAGVAAVVSGADGKQKTVVRSGGGQTWQDPSLLEWDPAHFRLFVGNLAGEVTDESLLKAFAKYTSVQKARVVRDKRTTKSKGYGFVSFSDGDEYFQAAKDMQGKYIGSHPVLLRRSTTEIRPTKPVDKRKHGKGGKGGNGGSLGANTGAGVLKKQSKTKGGLRILG